MVLTKLLSAGWVGLDVGSRRRKDKSPLLAAASHVEALCGRGILQRLWLGFFQSSNHTEY